MKVKRAELLLRIEAAGLALLMLVQLVACDSAPTSSAAIDQYNTKWRKIADGSMFAKVANLEAGLAIAMRCWPGEKRGFRCLQVIESTSSGFQVRDVVRVDIDKLPEWMPPFIDEPNGYSCGTASGSSEKIGREGATLTTNRLDTIDDGWSRAYVNSYIAKNGVTGSRWFPCVKVLRAVIDGSLETVSTTSVTRNDLGPR